MVDKNLTQDTPMLPVIDCSALLILMVVVSARAGIGFNRLGGINHDMLRAVNRTVQRVYSALWVSRI